MTSHHEQSEQSISAGTAPDSKPGESNITCDPHPFKSLVACARAVTLRRDWLEALRCWDAIRNRYPDYSAAYVRSCSVLRELGRLDEAEQLLTAAVQRFPHDEAVAIARASLANARRDWPAAAALWQLARERFPDNPWSFVGSIHALRATGCSDQVEALLSKAESALMAAKARGFDPAAALKVELDIVKARADWPAVKLVAQKIIASEPVPDAQIFLFLAQACWHLEDREAADEAAEQALRADPSLSDAWLVRAWVATDQGDGERTLSCYRRLAEINSGTARWSLKVVQLLNWLGHVKEAVTELRVVSSRWPNDPMVRMYLQDYGPAAALKLETAAAVHASRESEQPEERDLRTLLQRAPGPGRQLRSLVDNDPELDVLIAELKQSPTAVLVFTGGNDAITIPLRIFDHFMAALPITSIYLKDFKRLRFLVGIDSLSRDYQGTILALRDMLRTLGATRVCTLGNCDGAFAAIRYGVELGADRIIAFSAATYTPQDAAAKFEQARNLKRIRLAAQVPEEMGDLKPFLQASRHHAQIELFYDQEDPRDRAHALHLSGLPGVILRPQPSPSDQRLLRQFALSRSDFCGTLAEMFGVQSAAVA